MITNKGARLVPIVNCMDCYRNIYEHEYGYYFNICEECWLRKNESINIIMKQLLPYRAQKYKNKEDVDVDEDEDVDGFLQNTGRGISHHKRCSKCNDRIKSTIYIKHRTICKKCHNQNRNKYR